MQPVRIILLLLAGALLAGCLDVDTRIRVASNGSGTLTERMVLKGPMAEMMQSMSPDKGGVADREQAEAHAKELGEGVRVISVNPIPESEGIGAVAVFGFADVTRVRVKQNRMRGKNGVGADAPAAGDGKEAEMRFRFEPGPPAVLTVLLDQSQRKAGKPSSGAAPGSSAGGGKKADKDPLAEKMLAGVKSMLEGMRMAISVEVDGAIVETNATYRDGNRITLLELDVDRLLEADPASAEKLMPGADLEAMKEALANLPGVKVELESEVRVVFRPATVLTEAFARPSPAL